MRSRGGEVGFSQADLPDRLLRCQEGSPRAATAKLPSIIATARLLYERGLESFLPVLDAERSLYAADDKLLKNERDSALALVALYKSLGGGWQAVSADGARNRAEAPRLRRRPWPRYTGSPIEQHRDPLRRLP